MNTYEPITYGENFQFTGLLQLDTGDPLVGVTSAQLVFAPVVGEPPTNQRFVATGTFTPNAATGVYTFAASAADLVRLLVGHWIAQVVATLSSGQVRYSQPVALRVIAAL